VEYSEGKGRKSIMPILRFLCGSLRLCRLRTEGLVPVGKYSTYRSHTEDMCLVRLVAGCQQNLSFPRYLIGSYGREAGYGPMDQMVVELWIVSGALLLRGSGSVQIC
jgi:hypothetical protein